MSKELVNVICFEGIVISSKNFHALNVNLDRQNMAHIFQTKTRQSQISAF